jgi:two-component system nitrogen regulation response regulator GlnG
LLTHFLRQELAGMGEERLLDESGRRCEPWLSARLVARLADHDWPGNVRELRNVARRIAVGSRDAAQAELPGGLERAPDPAAVTQELPASLISTAPEKPASRPREAYRPISEVAEDELFAALRASRWNLAVTAERLRVSRTSLYTLVERHGGVRKASQLSRDEIASALERAGGDLDAAADDLRVSPHGLKIRRTELGIH